LEWIRDRLAGSLGAAGQRDLDNDLNSLRGAADSENLLSAADHATRLASLVRELTVG